MAKSSKHLSDVNLGKKRGHGGCAILWKRSLCNRVRPLPELGTDRMCVVELTIDSHSYYIVSVYLPHQNCRIDDFRRELKSLEDLCNDCNAKGSTIVCGDTNCHLGESFSGRCWGQTTPNAVLFANAMNVTNMRIVDIGSKGSGPVYTWSSDNGKLKSYIDHVAISDSLTPYLVKCEILPDEVSNVSDHLAIKTEIRVQYTCNESLSTRPITAWHKVSEPDIATMYTGPLEYQMERIMNNIEINEDMNWDEPNNQYDSLDIEAILSEMSCIMLNQSKVLPASKFNKSLKPYWNNTLSGLNKEKKATYNKWKAAGKPRSNNDRLFIEYKEAKRQFRMEKRREIYRFEKESMETLSKTQELDQRFFWHLVNKKRRRALCPVQSKDGELLIQHDAISNEWTGYYKELFSETIDSTWDEGFKQDIKNKINAVDCSSNVTLNGGPITESEVCRELNKMKNKKSPGWDNLTVEHLKYGGDATKLMITWVINFVLYTEHVPNCLKKGLLVPIPKHGKDCTVKDNNRGITLMPVIFKLLEKIVIEREKHWLHDNDVIDLIQSAGQYQCSSLHTSFLVQEAIAYNVNKGATVYAAFLDTRKAFDTVWIDGLMHKLLEKGLNTKIWRVLKSGYTEFKCAIYIGGKVGQWFNVERGVHQGAPFSMWLYMIFVNDLLQELQNSGFGICINNIKAASPAHADDIALLSLYKMNMNKLLNMALQYSRKWRYSYNEDKTIGMIWGKDKDPAVTIVMGDTPVRIVTACKHVGITLFTDRTQQSVVVNKQTNAARATLLAARGLGSALVPVPPTVLSKIYWAVVIPRLTYGLDVTAIEECHMLELEAKHRQNAKIVQGSPMNIPTPAPLATLGWLSLKSFILMTRILFMLRTICMPAKNVYKQILLFRLNEIVVHGINHEKMRSPVTCMYDALTQYGLIDKVISCMQTQDFGSFGEWKRLVKRVVWQNEIVKWKGSCLMYRELEMYAKSVKDIVMHPWWRLAKVHPELTRLISCTMSVLMGGQPATLQCNIGGMICRICGLRARDGPQHILFACPALNSDRHTLIQHIIHAMPIAMREDFEKLDEYNKMEYLISGMHCKFTIEWVDIYTREF